jgi:signal transduction histidine kinase
VEVASSGVDGLAVLADKGPFAVVVSDLYMPGMSGLDFIGQVRKEAPESICMLLTGARDQGSAASAVNAGGIFRYLTKPISSDDIRREVAEAVAQYHRDRAERRHGMEALLTRTDELLTKNQHLECLFELSRLLEQMEARELRLSDALLGVFRKAVERPVPPCIHIAISDLVESVGGDEMVAEAVFKITSCGQERGEVRVGRLFEHPALRLTPDECNLLNEMADRLGAHIGVLESLQVARERQRQLLQADKLASLGVMVAGVAHEINNPVNNIMLNTSLLRDALSDVMPILESHFTRLGGGNVGGLPYAEMRTLLPQMLDDMLESCERIRSITSDLKDASPVDYEKVHESIRVNDAVRHAVRMCGHMDKRFHERIDLSLAEGLPEVACSLRRLEQVLINLLQNAWQALKEPQARIVVETYGDAERGNVIINVRDEGPGMPPDVLERIKDPFFTTRRDQGGTGLGIFIANGIVEEMGGSLAFRSSEGKGTVACVRLPV